MNENNGTFQTFIDAVGGPDLFIWLVMFFILVVIAVVLYFLSPKEAE